MRIFLFFIFLFFSSVISAQKAVESVITVKKGSKYQFVNKQTRIAVDSILWDDVEPFINGFANVYRNKKSSLVDGSGKLIAPVEFDEVINFSNKLCAVKKEGKWGFIDESGKPVIPFSYDIVFNFSYPTATAVTTNKKWWLISNKAAVITQLDITVFYGFINGVAKVAKNNEEGVLYPDGRIVWNQTKAVVNNSIPWHPTPTNNLSVPCPDNIGFEYGDFTNWECFTGTVAAVGNTNVITVSPSPPVTGRHTIIPRQIPSLQDPWGFFDINAPDGSNFAVRLGSEEAGGQAERVRYSIHVPLNDSTFSLKYDYAVVFQNPPHEPWEQPRFISKLIDSATGNPVDCASLEFVATAALPGFKDSPRNPDVKFKPWSSVFYSLRGYGGKTLYLEFTTADCAFTAHWGYAYVDVQSTCGSPIETHYECLPPNQMSLTAPPGFQFYNWWSSDFSTLLGTGQQLNMNPGLPVGTNIELELIPYDSFGCKDTLLVKLDGTFDAQFDIVNPPCGSKTYTFYSRNIPSTTTTWDFGDGNTASGDTVIHTYSTPGSYQVTMNVTMPGGCIGNAIHLVTIYPPTDMVKPVDQVICNRLTTIPIVFTGTPPGLVFNWTNSNPSIGLPATGTGTILPFTATNTGNTPILATITVTPIHITCPGTPKSFTITVNPSPDMTVAPVSQALCNGSITNAVTFTPTLSGTTFNWTNDNPSIGLPATGSGDIPAFTAVNNSSVYVVAAIRVTPTNGTCPGIERVFTIRVNPTPDVTQPANFTACSNWSIGPINFSGLVGATIYNWTNDNPSIGLAATGNGSIAPFTGVNNGIIPATGFMTVSPTAYGCPGTPKTFTVTVNPVPNVIQPANQVLCNGAATTTVNFSGAISSTSFSWANNNPSIGLAANGNGDIPSFTAVNTTNAPVTATITVYPTAYGCPGAGQTFTITVNPIPNVLQPANQTLCNAVASSAVNFTSAVSGTVFSWTNDNASIGLAASGNGDILSFTATNTTNAPITATITVTPTANGCPGPSQSFTITVNPTPNIIQPVDQTLCNAAATNTVNFTGAVSGTSFTWTNDNISIGLAANGIGDIPSFTAINTTSAPVIATITVTPNVNSCPGVARSFTITVNPTPNLVTPVNQALCNGSATGSVNFTGAVSSTSFNWSNNAPSIGLAATGTGDIPSFTAINITNVPVLATISVAPFANGCQGLAQSFSITVFPTPNVVQPANQVVCNATTTNAVNFTGAVSGTGFAWTNDNISIGLAANGTGDIPSFTATNLTNAPVTATVTVTASASGCPGSSSQSFTITVNPTPNVVQPANQVLCNASVTNIVNFSGTVSGSGFNWTNNNPSIGLAASGNGNIPSFTATNLTNAPVTATIVITSSANSCTSPVTESFTITVNPTPNVVQPANQVLCNTAVTNATAYSGAVSGTSFSWTNDNTSIGLGASGAGDIPSFTAINTMNAPVIAKIAVAPSANGCPGPVQNFTIVVNPTPDIVQPIDQRICDGTRTNAIIFSGNVAGINFNWINNMPSIGLASGGTGNIGSFTGINSGTSPVTATIIITPVAKGCVGLPKTTTFTIDPNPTIDLGADLHLSTGTMISLNSTVQNGPIINWAWTPTTGLSCNDCPSPQATVGNNITYNVVVSTVHGCSASDKISISTFCTDAQFLLPNAFTPNGDGLNDVLVIRGKGFVVKDFRIFNRWGELVFQKTNFNPNDNQFGWDGKLKGKVASPGVFAYTTLVVCDNGIEYPYKGTIILLR